MPLVRRVAFLSLHTSPMEQPGSGDAGGMNVYIRALAAALAESGVEVEIFTRSTAADQPAVEHPSPGVCVHNVFAGPARKVPKEELPRCCTRWSRRLTGSRPTSRAAGTT